jgi:hypothetical protein
MDFLTHTTNHPNVAIVPIHSNIISFSDVLLPTYQTVGLRVDVAGQIFYFLL